jgi:hypothetical protein
MDGSLWDHHPQVDPVNGEQVYAEINTGLFWKLGTSMCYVTQKSVIHTKTGAPELLLQFPEDRWCVCWQVLSPSNHWFIAVLRVYNCNVLVLLGGRKKKYVSPLWG